MEWNIQQVKDMEDIVWMKYISSFRESYEDTWRQQALHADDLDRWKKLTRETEIASFGDF